MSPLAVQKQILEQCLATVIKELEEIATLNQMTDDWELGTRTLTTPESDPNSAADTSEAQEIDVALLADLETAYRNYKRALQKITLGTYGLCEVCSGMIAPSRLTILPHARTCSLHVAEESKLPL